MKTKIFLFSALLSLNFATVAHADGPINENQYSTQREDHNYYNDPTRYIEYKSPVYDDNFVANPNPHEDIVGWDPAVPLRRFINTIQEGVTDQQKILQLLSAPNVMWRSPRTGKETWVYSWMWSYSDEQDPNKTVIYMNHPGKRVKSNKHPVSMILTFNDKDIVESYTIRLLKIKKDQFDDY